MRVELQYKLPGVAMAIEPKRKIHVAHVEEIRSHPKILDGILQEKKSLGKPRRR
jgi:hypothetical protein